MKKNQSKNKKAGVRTLSFFITDDEYRILEEYAKESNMKVEEMMEINFKVMLEELHAIAKQQKDDFGVAFASPENCTCPDCVSRRMMQKDN